MKLAQRARKNAADQHADHRIAADSAKLYRRQLPDRIDRQGGQNGSDDADIIAFSKIASQHRPTTSRLLPADISFPATAGASMLCA